MALYFLDSSALVKRYVSEIGSSWVRALTDPASGHYCWIAEITPVEVVSALYRRTRSKTLTTQQAQQFEQIFRNELTNYSVIHITSAVLDQALIITANHALRAYDSVQLASILQLRMSLQPYAGFLTPILLSADQELNQAAAAEGLQVDDPNKHP